MKWNLHIIERRARSRNRQLPTKTKKKTKQRVVIRTLATPDPLFCPLLSLSLSFKFPPPPLDLFYSRSCSCWNHVINNHSIKIICINIYCIDSLSLSWLQKSEKRDRILFFFYIYIIHIIMSQWVSEWVIDLL